MKQTLTLITATLLLGLSSVSQAANLKDEIRQILKENPDIIYEVIRENPVEFIKTAQIAAQQAEQQAAIEKRIQEQKEVEAAFANPLKPEIRKEEAIRGTKGAPLTLIEYSDFECPFCQRAAHTVDELMKKYDGKIQFIYKHLPLDFHEGAMPASQYYEALRMQDEKLAFAFHDEIFKDISKLKAGEPYIKEVAQKVGANMKKLEKTLKDRGDEINTRIQQDIAEAQKFRMTGTPGFVLNGVPLRGAHPISSFERIIDELKKRKLAKL
ncbi:MAG: thioredoxin domain-containing protein [Chromatiales bacterium]|nr:thioredoxin domain-containing protein [Chromatiales bacterium]